jgi:hypothetical protein
MKAFGETVIEYHDASGISSQHVAVAQVNA